jgi:hypothetical protein
MMIPTGQSFAITERAIVLSPNTLTFQLNDGGNALIAVFSATATTSDFGTPSPTLNDTAGNTWNMIYYVSGKNNGPSYNASAVYLCSRAIAFNGHNNLEMNASFYPADLLSTYALGAAFETNFISLTWNSQYGDYLTAQTGGFAIFTPSVHANELWIGFAFDSSDTVTPEFDASSISGYGTTVTGGVINPSPSDTSQGQFLNAITSGISDLFFVPVNSSGSPDNYGFGILLEGSNSSGGPNAQTLVFSINKGPLPIVPKEGRAIATVQIDCTQQTVVLPPIDYPEYANYGDYPGNNGSPTGFVICEFDLEHLFQGAGLSEVRTLSYYARPAFTLTNRNREDLSPFTYFTTSGYFPPLLTNKITLQTVLIGSAAANLSSNGECFGSYAIVPFPGNKNALKYRFIAPVMAFDEFGDPQTPIGKYILQFLNFEINGSVESVAGLLSSQSGGG